MKKLLFLAITFALLSPVIYAQTDTVHRVPARIDPGQQLLKKSKKQNTAAWLLLGSGIALDVLAYALVPKDYSILFGKDDGEARAIISGLLFIGGSAGIISSIPVFIASGINRRKAGLLLNTTNVQIAPHFKTNEWQLNTGIVIRF